MDGRDRSFLPRVTLGVAAFLGAAGVALGAIAAHLEGTGELSVASSFLLFHAPAILALGAHSNGSRLISAAQASLIVGAILFSGTLSADVLAGIQFTPSPAPLGGTLLILGWLLAGCGFLFKGAKH
jgi:uncharacterized membrane protein YgdD (TMEM256/DUF423 family)